MTLPAFAAEHRRLQHGARSHRYLLSTGRSAANPPTAVAAWGHEAMGIKNIVVWALIFDQRAERGDDGGFW